MKPFRKFLRYWIGLASVVTFLGGWVILAHSPKPVQPGATSLVQSAALPTLPALPAIQAYGGSNGSLSFFSTPAPTNPSTSNSQLIQPVQPSQNVPLLMTRGS